MSFGSGDPRKRPGLFESFRAAMTPPPLPVDDGQPLKPPRTVVAATVMAILAGVVFLFIGGVSLATTDTQLDNAVKTYNDAVAQCVSDFGGIGDTVVVPAGASTDDTNRAESCKQYRPLTPETISGARTQNIIISAIIVVVGLIAAVGGWFLRSGTGWSRLTVAGAVVLSIILTLVFQVSNLFTLVATLLPIIAVMLSYIGKGGVYFAQLKARRKG